MVQILSSTASPQIAVAAAAGAGERARLVAGLASGSAAEAGLIDPAAYAIATGQATQIQAYDRANGDLQSAVSAANVASAGLASISDDLSRIRSLAVQANSSFNSSSDIAAIQNQIAGLTEHISATASSVKFNGVPLLDGSLSGASVDSGSNAGDVASLSIPDSSASALGIAGVDVGNGNAANVQAAVDAAGTQVLGTQAALGASIIAMQTSVRNNAVTSVNLEASRSSIADLNVSSATSALASAQVRGRFATALLAQGNVSASSLLHLSGY